MKNLQEKIESTWKSYLQRGKLMRNLVVSLQVIAILFWGSAITMKGLPNKPEELLMMFFFFIPPIVTLYYLYLSPSEGENLISLWVDVEKKKLKKELADSD
jgi:hypothetical protein